MSHYQCVGKKGYVYANDRGFVSKNSLEVLRLEGMLIKYTTKNKPGFYKDSFCHRKMKFQ